MVGAAGPLLGAFVDNSGVMKAGTSQFNIGSAGHCDPICSHTPRVKYSQDLNNGQGGFLVTWQQNDSGNPTNVHAAVVSYPAGVISADRMISDPATPALFTLSAPISYSGTSHRFLVAWQALAGGSIQGRFVDLTGAPFGSVMTFETRGTQQPALSWNPATDEFGLSASGFQEENGAELGAFLSFRRISAVSGALSARVKMAYSAGTFDTAVVVNPSNNHYVVAWQSSSGGYNSGTKYAEFDQSGALLASGVVSTSNLNAIAYNAASGTILEVGIGNSYEILGRELDGAGVPRTAEMELTDGGSGSFAAHVTERTGARQWNISYSQAYVRGRDQIIETSSAPPAQASDIRMSIDTPRQGGFVDNSFVFGGWAIDRGGAGSSGIDAVHVWAVPSGGGSPIFVGAISSFLNRDDIGNAFGASFSSSGFGLVINLPDGSYTLAAYPHSSVTGTFGASRSISVSVGRSLTRGSFDFPTSRPTYWQKLAVSGWAIDQFARGGTGVDAVHIWAYPNPGSGQSPVFLGAAAYGYSRSDIGGIFGGQFTPSGFILQAPDLPAGLYRIFAFAHSTVSGEFAVVSTADVTITSAMAIDQPSANAVLSAGSPFAIAGWAVDRNSTSDAGVDVVHVWAFGPGGAQFLGVGAIGFARPDVGAILGAQFANCGFSVAAPGLAHGTYTIVVYAHSRLTGTFNEGRAVQVTVN